MESSTVVSRVLSMRERRIIRNMVESKYKTSFDNWIITEVGDTRVFLRGFTGRVIVATFIGLDVIDKVQERYYGSHN